MRRPCFRTPAAPRHPVPIPSLAIPILAILGLALACGLATELEAQTEPAPLDPLSAQEIEASRGLAQVDASVASRINGRRYALGSIDFLMPPKLDDGSPPRGRYAQALLCVYEDGSGVRAVLDLAAQRVLEVTTIPCDEVPLGITELEEARALALAHPEVRTLLGGSADLYRLRVDPDQPDPDYEVNGLKVVATEESEPCFGERCVALSFRGPGGYVSGTDVTVNMTRQTVSLAPSYEGEELGAHAHGARKRVARREAPRGKLARAKAPGGVR